MPPPRLRYERLGLPVPLKAPLTDSFAPLEPPSPSGALADPGGPLGAFLARHPEYAVLPAPYFEPGVAEASHVELRVHAPAFLPPGMPWRAELDVGRVFRYPETGHTTEETWAEFVELGAASVPHAELRLYARDGDVEREVAILTLGTLRPRRFQAAFQPGPYTRHASREWGEEGLWLVLLQMRQAPVFDALADPVLYVGGDFNLKRVEFLVRYLRVRGYNAFGYRPAYDRRPEPIDEMAREDLALVREFLSLAAPGRRAHVVGLCVGGLHARALAQADAATPGARCVATVTGVGTPNHGSELADLYHPLLARLEARLTGKPMRHPFKDTCRAMRKFNREVEAPSDVPHRMVVLDATGMRVDDMYAPTGPLLQWMVGLRTRRAPWSIATDGLLTVECQLLGEPYAVWRCDHNAMLNYGRTASHFDGYTAHRELIDAVAAGKDTP